MSKLLDKPTPSVSQIADKFHKTKKSIANEIKKGEKVEKEHTNKTKVAREIASDHTGEDPHYYEKLNKAKLEETQINEISKELAARYIQKAQASAHVGIQGWLPEDPKAPFKKFHRLQGVWRAAQRGGWPKQDDATDPNTDWRTGEPIKKEPEPTESKPVSKKRKTRLSPAEAEKEILRRSKTKATPTRKTRKKSVKEEMNLQEISKELLTRYYEKANKSDVGTEDWTTPPDLKRSSKAARRLKGINMAAKKGAKTGNLWNVKGDDKPTNSLEKIMRKKVYRYGEEPPKKPTKREVTGMGRERLVKAIHNLKGQAWALSYPGRLATPQQREPDMFWQGPTQPDELEIPKAMAHRQRVLGKIERLTSRLNQYGNKDPEHPAKTPNSLSPMQIAQSKSFAPLPRLGKDKSPIWPKGQKSGYQPVKEETEMDTKDIIREAINSILNDNLIEMKEHFNEVLEEKSIEKLDEAKRVIASSYFAGEE